MPAPFRTSVAHRSDQYPPLDISYGFVEGRSPSTRTFSIRDSIWAWLSKSKTTTSFFAKKQPAMVLLRNERAHGGAFVNRALDARL